MSFDATCSEQSCNADQDGRSRNDERQQAEAFSEGDCKSDGACPILVLAHEGHDRIDYCFKCHGEASH
jgi:hypothetical protein